MKTGTLDTRPRETRDGDDWVERVRAASDIVDLIGQTVALKRVGRNWVGLCPFHSEKTASFTVNAERQFYHCFSCKAGGDVFRYVQETERVGFIEAVELLSRRAGIEVPERRSGEKSVRRPILEALDAAASAYEQWLADPQEGAASRAYLAERGLSPETIRTFRLGLAPDGWEHLIRRLGTRFGLDVLIEAGLAARRDSGRGGGYDRFRNRLMVPLIAPGGAVVGFGARALEQGQEPKYLNSSESAVYHKRSFLYGYEQARKDTARDGELILVEGYFDVISLHQAGVRNVVATSGTALTPEHAKLLQRLVPGVVLTFDGDAAGQDAMLRSLGTLLAVGLDVRVADLSDGEDPDLLIRRRGAEGWNAVRAAALDPVDFVYEHGFKRGGRGDARERALQLVVGLANEMTDPVRQRLLLERGAQVFGVPERVLVRAVGLKRTGQHSEAPVRAAVASQSRSDAHPERRLLQALLVAPEHRNAAIEHLTPQDFLDPVCQELAESLWAGGEPESDAAISLARELIVTAPEGTDWEPEVAGWLNKLRVRRLKRRSDEVRLQLERVQRDRPADVSEANRLMAEWQGLLEEIKALNRAEHAPRGGDVLPPN